MNYSELNKNAYEALAIEYEQRTKDLLPITAEAMNYFAAHIKPVGKVLDVGCGVGLAMNILHGNGFIVSGIDISPAMVKFAKLRNPELEVINGDFLKQDFSEQYDGILTFAFIHLFPKNIAEVILEKIKSLLKPGGVAFISSTESQKSSEGWFLKEDYSRVEKRFRKYWTEIELENSITKMGFKKVELRKHADPFGKVWMDFIAQARK